MKFDMNQLKQGTLVMHKYRWKGESKRDYVYKVKSLEYGGKGANVTLIKVREDGKWKSLSPKDAFFWKYEFEIGPITPKGGWGRAFIFKKGE